MKKILITGGAGFVGYHLCKELLLDSNSELFIMDNLQRGKMDEDFTNLLQSERVHFYTTDLTAPNALDEMPRDLDEIYHLAAVNGTKWFYKVPHEVLRINIQSLFTILEWIGKNEKKPKLCFTSSNEAYASALAAFNQLPIPTPEEVPLVISDPYNPRWSYGGTKLIGELMVIHYAAAYQFPAIIVRPHNFYGPRAGYDHVIPEFCQKIIKRTEPFAVMSPEETRTFCYITDAVKAMIMLMESEKTSTQPAGTYHIGDTNEINIGQLSEYLFEVARWKPSEIVVTPSLPGSVKRRLANIEKIKNTVGWEPTTSLQTGLAMTFDWYQKHPPKE
jgi:nucleoside-diphosphate-sugar epimerase